MHAYSENLTSSAPSPTGMFAFMFIDLAFAAFAAIGFYWGYSRGIIRTVVSVVAVFVGFLLAVRFAPEVTAVLAKLFEADAGGALPLVGFVVTFTLVLLGLRLLSTAAERALRAVHLDGVNKLAGGLAAALAATLLFSILLGFADGAGLVAMETKVESITYPALDAFPEQAYALFGKARPVLDDLRDAGREAVGG